MAQRLDILGATVISGFILLMIANSNIRISDFSDELLISTITQYDADESTEIIEFDLYKIGYHINVEKIKTADSNRIEYYTDFTSPSFPEGNGNIDSIKYFIDTSAEISLTNNPNDYPLYRVENTNSKLLVGRVSSFMLSYYDSLSNELSYSSLQLKANREKIKSICVIAEYQALYALDSSYKTIVWEKTIRPRNLN